jgi:hypothetical protein
MDELCDVALALAVDARRRHQLDLFEVRAFFLHRHAMTVRKSELPRVLRHDVVRQPAPLAVTGPVDLLSELSVGCLGSATRADHAHAPVVTEAPYFPEILKIPV